MSLVQRGLRGLEPKLRREVMALGEQLAGDGAARDILGRDASYFSRPARAAVKKQADRAPSWSQAIAKVFSGLVDRSEGRPQIALNQEVGSAREDLVMGELRRIFPEDKGFGILKQPYLRDASGAIAHDARTGQARRLDFAVVRRHRVVRSLEVTSQTADKVDQMAKEARIRKTGGTFVKDMASGEIIRLPAQLKTRVYRIP